MQYDVYNYVCHKVCSISVLVLAVGVILLFYPTIMRDFRFLVSEGCCELEAWSLTLTVENGLMISENMVLRGIFDLRGRKWQEDG